MPNTTLEEKTTAAVTGCDGTKCLFPVDRHAPPPPIGGDA